MTGNIVVEDTTMIGDYPVEYLLERAREIVSKRTKDWEITNKTAEDRIPRFDRSGTQLLVKKGC